MRQVSAIHCSRHFPAPTSPSLLPYQTPLTVVSKHHGWILRNHAHLRLSSIRHELLAPYGYNGSKSLQVSCSWWTNCLFGKAFCVRLILPVCGWVRPRVVLFVYQVTLPHTLWCKVIYIVKANRDPLLRSLDWRGLVDAIVRACLMSEDDYQCSPTPRAPSNPPLKTSGVSVSTLRFKRTQKTC